MDGGAPGGLLAAIAAGAAVGEVVTKSEQLILNVPLSMLYVAVAGTMFGFYLLPGKEVARMSAPDGASVKQRTLYAIISYALVGFAVVAYAFIAAWAVQLAAGLVAMMPGDWVLHSAAMIPATGLVGVGIRPWLPKLLAAVERRADRVIGGDEK